MRHPLPVLKTLISHRDGPAKLRFKISFLFYAVRSDFSFACKQLLSAVVRLAGFILRRWLDVLIIVVATVLVVVAERFNSSIKTLCDFVEWRESHKIRIIKDIAVAAVGLLLWAVIPVVETVRLWKVFTTP